MRGGTRNQSRHHDCHSVTPASPKLLLTFVRSCGPGPDLIYTWYRRGRRAARLPGRRTLRAGFASAPSPCRGTGSPGGKGREPGPGASVITVQVLGPGRTGRATAVPGARRRQPLRLGSARLPGRRPSPGRPGGLTNFEPGPGAAAGGGPGLRWPPPRTRLCHRFRVRVPRRRHWHSRITGAPLTARRRRPINKLSQFPGVRCR